MNGENLLSWVLAAAFVAAVIFLTNTRADAILNNWARRSGYKIVKRDYA